MFENGNGSNMYMPVAPAGYGYGGYGNGGFFGGDGVWGGLLLGLLFGGLGGWGGFGGFGGGFGNMFGMDAMMLAPYFFNTQTQNDVNRGFDNSALSNQIASVQGSIDALGTRGQISDLQTSVSNGFANAEVANCNREINYLQTAYNNQIADLNRSFDSQVAITAGQNAIQSQLAKCCCDNQLQSESLRATILAENCEDRNQALLNTRDIIANQTAGVQRILDVMCQDKIDAKNEKIQELQTQVALQNLAASQAAQTAAIVADNTAQTQYLVNRIAPYPVPAVPFNGFYGWNNGWNGNWGGCCGGNSGF